MTSFAPSEFSLAEGQDDEDSGPGDQDLNSRNRNVILWLDQIDPNNPLPYGGITDIHGNIIKAFTKEEEDAALARAKKAFGKKK